MRYVIIFTFIAIQLAGQQKTPQFKLAQNAQGQYTEGTILAKLKPENKGVNVKDALRNQGHLKATKSFVSEKQQAQLRSRTAPRATSSNVDLSLYIEIAYDGSDVESFINEMYATGLFEIVEPDYTATLSYTPSDPSSNQSRQYYLNKIKAFEAWDVSQGSPNIIIGIVDSGGDLNHPDLEPQLYNNLADPIDGLDNDNDGYIDNNRGWDFIGADTLNNNLPDFKGDNNPNNNTGGFGGHGTGVAGCAAAATDNGIGISGVGFNSKLLFTKHSADNQNTTKVYRTYSGVLYAATHGAKIINCSWGGYVFSQIQQDIISYVSLDLGCLVVAAAGNNSTGVAHYPSGYDHVLSVAASNQNDVRSLFSNYGKTIDLTAPGQDIFTTTFDNTYGEVDGTSFAAPIVAGAAALVWAKNPTWTNTQVGEQIRVTADESIYAVNSVALAKKLGKGRLDIQQALTKQFPSLRASKPKLINNSGGVAQPGEEAFLSMDFTNFLSPTSAGITINLTAVQSNLVTFTRSSITPGIIQTNQKISNRLNPFTLRLSSNIASNTTIELILTYSDGEYSDYQYLNFLVNPSFLDIDDNQIITTIASNGRLGYENTSSQSNGVGFVVDENNVLFEMGLIMGTSAGALFDNVRSTGGTYNQDFTPLEKIREIVPGERSSAEIFGSFTDNKSSKTVSVNYRSLVWNDAPFDRFIILEYKVKNISEQTLSGFHFGIFADWDVSNQGAGDVARWDNTNQMGYVYPAQPDDRPYAGISLLTGASPGYYAIDNNHQTPDVPFGLYDGFTDSEKYTTLSSGIGRTEAGMTNANGADVSHVVSSGPYTILPDEEVTIAFALLAAQNFNLLREAAQQADTAYNFIIQATRPTVNSLDICFGATALIEATGATQYNWYKDFTGGEPFYTGNTYQTGVLFNDTTFYVSNADESYESVRTPANIHLRANPSLFSSGSGIICEGGTLTLSVAEADAYLWNTGATTRSIEINASGNYSVQVQSNTPSCINDSEIFSVTVSPVPTASFSIEGDLIAGEALTFLNTSTGATSYNWTFGDNINSQQQNPIHTYNSVQQYTVTLTAVNELGCSDVEAQDVQIITGLDKALGVQLYPVPARNTLHIRAAKPHTVWKIYDANGKLVAQGKVSAETEQIDITHMVSGLYVLKASAAKKAVTIKFFKE